MIESIGHLVALETLPLLLVVLPILSAALPLAIGLRMRNVGWYVACIVCVGLFVAAVVIADAVYIGDAVVQHNLGGFAPPIGIPLVADRFSTAMALLVAGVALGVLAYTRHGGPRGNSFYAGYLLLTGGLMGVTFTGDVFNLFVFLEITGLATYALIARGESGEAAVAALKYLILGTLGASLYLIGVGFLFVSTGHLNMVFLGDALGQVGYDDPLVLAAFVFVFVGFAIKVAQWPVHTWQPDAYQHAPDGVTPMIAALVSTVSAYALGRVLFTVFTVDFMRVTPYVSELIVGVGAVSVIAGSILAVIQLDVKRMLAYSSVSQFGLIVAAYGLLNETALTGAMIHLLGHGIMKAGLFLAVGLIAVGVGARTVDAYAGLARNQPYAAGALALLGIALVGIPPSLGFLGKWYIAVGAVEAEMWSIAVVIFLSTMLTLAYIAKLGERMYFHHRMGADSTGRPVATDGGEWPRRSIGMVAVVLVTAILVIVLGFAGAPLDDAFAPFVEEVFDT